MLEYVVHRRFSTAKLTACPTVLRSAGPIAAGGDPLKLMIAKNVRHLKRLLADLFAICILKTVPTLD